MKTVLEIIGHNMEPERAECQVKEIHEHYMRFVEWLKNTSGTDYDFDHEIYVWENFHKDDKLILMDSDEMYDYWSNLPENKKGE